MSRKIVVLSEIILNQDSDSISDSIGLYQQSVRKKPFECKYCGDDVSEPVEVLGTSNKPLYWECDCCDERYLMYNKVETEKQLVKALGTWTTPQDWYVPERDMLN